MLVITRRLGESVTIGGKDGKILGSVRYTADASGDRIRLAFDFPKEIEIHRSEIVEAVRARKAAADA